MLEQRTKIASDDSDASPTDEPEPEKLPRPKREKADREEILNYLRRRFGDIDTHGEPLLISVCSKNDTNKKVWQRFFLNVNFKNMFGTYAKKICNICNRERLGVLIGIGAMKEKPKEGSGKGKDITHVFTLVVDIDCSYGEHGKENAIMPDTIEEAKALLPTSFKPSQIVDTSGGIHAYYDIVDGTIDSEQKRVFIQALGNKLTDLVKIYEESYGYKKAVDDTTALSQRVRMPYTLNYKRPTTPKKVTVIETTGTSYKLDELNTLLDAEIKANNPFEGTEAEVNIKSIHTDKKSSSSTQYEGTDDLDYDIFRAGRMLEKIPVEKTDHDTWVHIGMILKTIGMPNEVWEQWSQTESRYNPDHFPKLFNEFDRDGALTIATLHMLAKEYGYSEKETRKEYYDLHPEKAKIFYDDSDETAGIEIADKLSVDNATLSRLFEGDILDEDFAHRLKIFCGKYIRLLNMERWMTYDRSRNVWEIGNKENATISPYALDLSILLNANAHRFGRPKLARAFKAANRRAKAITLLKDYRELRITTADLFNHPNLICVQNGVIDLHDGRLMQADPALLITQQANAVYDTAVDCTAINNFFADIMPDEETREGLKRWLGYCLTGKSTMKKFACWTGHGSNGKSLFGNLLAALFADYATSINRFALIQSTRTTDANAATPALAGILGKRLVLSEEIPENTILDSALLKSLTGNNDVLLRPLYAGEIVDKKHPYKFNIISNTLPTLSKVDDEAMTSRLIDFPFKVKFVISKEPMNEGERKADVNMFEKLTTPNNLSALLKVLVDAAQDWNRTNELIISKEMQAATEEHIAESDFIGIFITEFFSERNTGSEADYTIKRKDFLNAIKARYPRLSRQYETNAKLHQAILNHKFIIEYKARTNDNMYRFLPDEI